MSEWRVVYSNKPQRRGEAFIARGETFVLKVYADSVPEVPAFASYLARQLGLAELRLAQKQAGTESYDPALGVYDEASLRAAGKYWEALEYESNARDDWAPGEHDRLHRMQIAVERAMSAHDHTITADNEYVRTPA